MEHIDIFQVAVGVDVNLVTHRDCLEAADSLQRLPLRRHQTTWTQHGMNMAAFACRGAHGATSINGIMDAQQQKVLCQLVRSKHAPCDTNTCGLK
jgi:hypothetical protein